jgi:hypothetical protein
VLVRGLHQCSLRARAAPEPIMLPLSLALRSFEVRLHDVDLALVGRDDVARERLDLFVAGFLRPAQFSLPRSSLRRSRSSVVSSTRRAHSASPGRR